MDDDHLKSVLEDLLSRPKEEEWFEFKHDYVDPDEIGEYLSALANSAALCGKERAYITWGIDDATHRVVGTKFRPKLHKVKGQELESWLNLYLNPKVQFVIHEFLSDGLPVAMFEICPASHAPVRFKDVAYIRVGSYKKKLKDFPDKERKLWALTSNTPFEEGVAMTRVSGEDVLDLIDYEAYYVMTSQPQAVDKCALLDRLTDDRIIRSVGSEQYSITNLGAMLWAKHLDKFESLSRKAVRVILYEGSDRVRTKREQLGQRGYANGFQGLIGYINDQIPHNEVILQALRREVKMFPELAIRELVANALIHQDFSLTGTGPMIEIFADRVEITNPGKPLIDPLRFVDALQSRNEKLAKVMRRANVCEERGSGIDKVLDEVEYYQLPAPEFRVVESHTKAILYAHRELSEMDRKNKIQACYLHACLCAVQNRQMSNASLRRRLGIADENYSSASKIISDTVNEGLIKPYDPGSKSRKHAKYLPFWA